MQYDYSKLLGRIIEKFGTRSAFAKAAGLSPTSVSLKLGGKTDFSRVDVEHWADLLDITLEEYPEYFFKKKL